MRKNSQNRKEWAKVIAAGLVTALVLNSTVSIYAEEGGVISSPSPSATVEATPVSTPVPAVEPTAIVPEVTPEATAVATQQPADTGNENGNDGAAVEATPVSTPEEQVSPTPTAEPENIETGEVPTATPVEGNGESVGADTEASPEISPDATPETSPEISPSVSPSATPEVSVSPSVSPSASPGATPTAEVGAAAAVSCDETGISGEGINKIIIHFATEGLTEEDSFALVLSTENDWVTISGNAFSAKEEGAYYVSALQTNALDIVFNQLAGEAFTVQASGENIDFAYNTLGDLSETEEGICAEVTISASSKEAEDEITEETSEEKTEGEEKEEVVLTEQSLVAHASDDAWVYVSGLLPEGATVTAVPVSVEVEGKVVLAAYDITILDADGNVYEITESVTVSITATALKETEAEEVSVYHMADENSQAEKVADVGINYNKVSFEAEGFSIYILTEDEQLDESDGSVDGKYNISSYVDAELRGSSEGLSRNDTLTFDFTYEIAGEALATAKENLTWYYSLESVLSGPNAVFKSIVDGGTGYIFDAENSSLMAGEYKIVGEMVEFHIYESYIKDRENVKGTFTLDCQLDENKIGSATQKEIAFDGDSVTVTFEEVSVGTTKKVNGVAGDAGEVKVNGDYTIPYEIMVTPNAGLNSLVLTDTLSAGQTIKNNEILVEVQSPNGWKWAHVLVTLDGNNSFTLNLAGLADDVGNQIVIEAGTTYKITYNTVIDSAYYGTELTNNASWDWTGDGTADSSNSTSITPIKEVDLSKKTVSKETDGEGNTIFTYTITVGDGITDLGGYSIQDTISLNQQPVGTYAVMTAENASPVNIPFNELTYGTSGEAVLFTHPFSAGQTGPYTITYQTELCKGESLTGWQSISNKLETKKDGTAVEWDSTYDNVDFGGQQSVGVDKEFAEMDLQNNLIWWEITVTLPDDTVIDNAVLQESDFKYNKKWTDYYMEIDWSQVTVNSKATGAAIDANAYTVDAINDQILFAQLTEAVVVRVPVKCPAEALENDVVFKNTAIVKSSGTELGRDNAEYTYKADYEMTKFVKTPYDPTTGLIEWEVDINPNKLTYNPDVTVYLTDKIPAGMEYYSDTNKDAWCYYETADYQNGSNKLELEWIAQDTWKAAIGNLSGTKYCVTYWTKVTSDNPEPQSFTNKADLYKSDGSFLANADSTVTVTRELLDKTHKQNKDIITYTIDVNKEAMDLSDDDKLVLMDQIPDGVELVINNQKGTVIFTDMKTGLQITNGVSYSYQNRNLVITVPDNKYIRITYDVRVSEISNMAQFISNTITLSGKVNVSDTDEGSFVVSSHSSTITGDNLGKLVINKLDSASLSTTLQGAEFEVIKYTLSDDESTVETETVTTAENNTTDEAGVLKVEVEAGYLYSWEEKSAPNGYVLEGETNYFIVYNDAVTKADAEALIAKIKNVQGYENISVTYSEDTMNKTVTNAKEITGNAQLTIQKSFVNGQILSDAEKAKITFVVTNSAGSLIKSIKYSDMTNGSYTITNLPYDTYKVSELYGSKSGYTLTTTYEVDDQAVNLASTALSAEKQQATVEITNKYEGAKLVITKTFAGVNLTEEEKNRVQFIVTGPNNYSRTFTYAEMTEGKMELDNLPYGSYSVQEYCNAGNGYTVKTTYKVGSSYGVGTYANAALSKDKAEETVAFNNTYSLGKLTVKKSFTGGENLTPEQKNALTFTVIGKDYNNEWANTIYGPEVFTYADMTAGMKTLDVPFGYYTVTESNAEVDGYTVETTYKVNGSAVDGNATNVEIVNWDANKTSATVEVINNYTEIPTEKISVSVTKNWEDNNNQDGIRPDSVTIELFADGINVPGKTIELSEENGWTYTWTNLVKEKADGTEINYSIAEAVPEGYTADISGDMAEGYTVTNTHETEKTAIAVSKTWSDNDDQDGIRPENITVKLLAGGTETGETLELNAANNWTGSFTDLDKYEAGAEINYSVEEVEPAGYEAAVTGDAVSGYTITNTHIPEVTSVKVTKEWQDNNNSDKKRPASITVQLFADDSQTPLKEQAIYPDGQGAWSYTFTGLPKYKDGEEIVYTVQEIQVPEYTTTVAGDAASGYTITNTHEVETIDISGTKVWENTESVPLPDKIVVNLLQNGIKVQSKEVTASDNWVFSFTDLQKYVDGTEAVYTITEDPLPEYSTTITQDSNGDYVITNKYIASKTSRTVKKIWVDGDDQDGMRTDSVTVQLLADGVASGEAVTLNETNNWEYTWDELPEFDGSGTKSIVYTVKETTLPQGYSVKYDEKVATIISVTNTHTPETININATKSWDDADNQDGIRPDFVTINLLKNGNVIASQQVTDDGNGNWACAFNNLPKYENGQEITYMVEEATVPEGYTSDITGDIVNGFVITNIHEPEVISISGTKTWDDDNDRDGKRPGSITVNLLADGVETQEVNVTVDVNDEWKYNFTDLPKYKNVNGKGVEIVYSVTEDVVDGYTTTVTKTDAGYDITNSYTPGKVSRSVEKIWDDGNNRDGIRPVSITVQLTATDPQGIEQPQTYTVTLNDGNDWKHIWTELPQFINGRELVYTVEEVGSIAGYTSASVVDDNTNTTIITNTHTPEVTSINVTKEWDDAGNQDGKRPESISVKLLANGSVMGGGVLTAQDSWEYTFANLPKKISGTEVVYTIEEVVPEGYELVGITGDASNGYVITNKHTPEVTEISGEKTWDDSNNADRKRPASITVNLLADGVKVAEKVVSANSKGEWKYTFTNVAKYADGKEIVYTVSEEPIANYSTTVEGFNITNTYTPEVTSRSVEKIWDDNDNVNRPASVKVQILANGKATGDPVVLSAENDWKYTWSDLQLNANGKAISYTVKELNIPSGYRAIYSAEGTTLVVKNTTTPAPTPVPTPTPTKTPAPEVTPAPTETPNSGSTPTPGNNSTPTPKKTAIPSVSPSASPGATPGAPERTPSIDRTPGPENTPERDVTPAPELLEDEPTVLKSVRVEEKGVKGAVRGARRGLEYAVLGRRRRPSTGDSPALLLWMMTLAVAVGGNLTAGIMLAYAPRTGRSGKRREE